MNTWGNEQPHSPRIQVRKICHIEQGGPDQDLSTDGDPIEMYAELARREGWVWPGDPAST